jgi:hypothetical protein
MKERKATGKGSRREICMREGMEYYAGVAGGEAAYDQTGELEQLVLVKLEYSSGEMEKA